MLPSSECRPDLRGGCPSDGKGDNIGIASLRSWPVYVVITPAHNEAATLRIVSDCLAAQTVPPLRWVVVDDASSDATADLVRELQSRYAWIDLISLRRDGERHFGGKAKSFNAGVRRVASLPFDYLANLDADVTFPPDYFAYLLNCIEADPRIGLVGTPFREEGFRGYDYRFTNSEHVSGACQLFRRACLEQVGGYRPIPSGGIDWVASTTARMLGWRTQTCRDKTLLHHRRMGAGNRNWGNLRLRQGRKDYMLGNEFRWEFLRCLYQAGYRPFILGGLLMMTGYLQEALLRKPRPIPEELARFVRGEHAVRLRALARRLTGTPGEPRSEGLGPNDLLGGRRSQGD
jgi:poly-beta-1,6-N-acetyl-D-glucosamine synthase